MPSANPNEFPPDLIVDLPLEALHESPFNPRRTFLGIEELAASIRAEGRIHQPLLVRPRVVDPTQDDSRDGYEVIFGHRRLRAAEAAGLRSVPCMVRAMSDAEARSAQIAENLQRADVHPIEEAEGFRAMLDQDGISADELAEAVGKSRSYVYGRLKLLKACTMVREACLRGDIGSEVALLIARLRTEKLQAKALGAIKGKSYDLKDGGKKSFRLIRELLKDNFTLDISQSIFPPEDATLVPAAGVCSACPKLSGNAPEFQDLAQDRPHPYYSSHVEDGEPLLCTDPDCFEGKKKAHLARAAEALRAEGKTVVDGAKARQAVGATGEVKGAYIALKDVRAELKKAKAKPETVLIQNPRNGKVVEAVRREDLKAAGIEMEAPARRTGGGYDPEAARREREETERQVEAENAARQHLLKVVRATAASRPRSVEELRLVVIGLLIDMEDSIDAEAFFALRGTVFNLLAKEVETMHGDALALLLLDLALARELEAERCWHLQRPPAALNALATLYGIDIDAARAGEVQTPVPTPPTAARAAKKGAAAAGSAAAADKPAGKAKAAKASKTGPSAQDQSDDAGSAGERDTHTRDIFDTEAA